MPNYFPRPTIGRFVLTGLLSVALAGGAAFAQNDTPQEAPPPPQSGTAQQAPMQGRHHREMSPDRQLKRLTKKLNLTQDQQSQIKPILENNHQQMQQLWQDKSMSRQDRRSKAMSIKEECHNKIEAVLNDTQKQQFEQMMQKRKGMHRGRMQQGPPPPPDNGGAPPPPPAGAGAPPPPPNNGGAPPPPPSPQL